MEITEPLQSDMEKRRHLLLAVVVAVGSTVSGGHGFPMLAVAL